MDSSKNFRCSLLLLLVSCILGSASSPLAQTAFGPLRIYKVYLPNDSGPAIEKAEIRKAGKVILVHTLSEVVGDCNSVSTEEGTYVVQGDSLILYSSWDFSGQIFSPYGWQKQVYVRTPAGNLRRRTSQLYIEWNFDEIPGNAGYPFLHQNPQNTEEQALYAGYVKGIENAFDGTFVFGKAAAALHKEVDGALAPKKRK